MVFWYQNFGDISSSVCSYYSSSVSVAEGPPFGKQLLTRFTICSFCILTIVILVISRFGFEGWIWVLIASVPDMCIRFSLLDTHNYLSDHFGPNSSTRNSCKKSLYRN